MKVIKDGVVTRVPECISQQEPFESMEVSYGNEDNKLRIVLETHFISETAGYLLRYNVYDKDDLVIKTTNTQISIDEAEMIARIHSRYKGTF